MNRAERIWAAMPVPAILIDAADRIAEVNAAAEDFLGTSEKSLRGAPIFDRVFIDAPIDGALARMRRDRAPLYANAVEVGGGQAPPETCNLSIAPVPGLEGHILVMLSPRQVAGRLGKAGEPRNAARAAIGMAEMLAHEIKNPLAGITGAAQLLSMGLDPEGVALTDLIVAESRRIVALLDQVEQFGNLAPPRRRAVNLHTMLDRARNSAALGAAAQMRIEPRYDPSLPAAWIDSDQMQQAVLNLMRNAAEAAGPGGGTIVLRSFYDAGLRLRRPDGSGRALPLQIEVIDDGPGIAADMLDGIFDPFVSGRENGTGLGLALVSRIVADHEGLVSVDSRPGRTAFRISLPAAPETALRDPTPQEVR
ncbi:two-component system sensor histidine kinase NtrB [Palleronia sediminis]|uniref:two-component system sensor histidine kinase NtrB n=1 Tax=Palleronia sediminis TaxID=2547833 RepID=UPI0023EA7135|nr:ATP-binding protein [Palleronia sediminis]